MPASIGSKNHSSAESRLEYARVSREERLSRSVPWRLCGYKVDPATSAAWTREASCWAEEEYRRLYDAGYSPAVPESEADTLPASPSGLIGQKFGLLTVVSERPGRKGFGSTSYCTCECGGLRETMSSRLRDGRIRSCGCLSHRKKAEAR